MSPSASNIPLIDLAAPDPDLILQAATTHGFLFLANDDAQTGLSSSQIDDVFGLAEKFFKGDVADKEEVRLGSSAAGENVGWVGKGMEKLDEGTKGWERKEALNLRPPPALSPPTSTDTPSHDTLLPRSLRPHAPTLHAFQRACATLSHTLLHHLALALALPADWFTSRHAGPHSDPTHHKAGTITRLLYYPAAPASAQRDEDEASVRAGAHSDYGTLTLLFRRPGEAGLEIWDAESGEWISVPVDPRGDDEAGAGSPPRATPILVNIGDLLEDWTAGLLRSTVHRVAFGAEGGSAERFSLAYFCHPLDEAELVAVPSPVVEEFVAAGGGGGKGSRLGVGGRPLTAREHLGERLGRTYLVG